MADIKFIDDRVEMEGPIVSKGQFSAEGGIVCPALTLTNVGDLHQIISNLTDRLHLMEIKLNNVGGSYVELADLNDRIYKLEVKLGLVTPPKIGQPVIMSGDNASSHASPNGRPAPKQG